MSAMIEWLGQYATVDGGKWQCDDPDLLGLLNVRKQLVGDSPSIPDLDEALAQDATEFGAVIIKHSDQEPSQDDETMY